jgi:TatD DNase family protein
MAFLRKLVASPGVLAIGEIGLDYFRDYAPTLLQREAFLEQLDMADALLKPAVFHVRDAYDDFLRILERRKRYCRYLIHCFAGNREDYQRAHAIDCYFGIGGTITYKKNDELREIVAEIPRDRVLLETDSPYLSPEPVRGKPNSPANLTYVVKEISKIWGVSEQTVVSVTTHNAGTFFGVPTVSNGALTTE